MLPARALQSFIRSPSGYVRGLEQIYNSFGDDPFKQVDMTRERPYPQLELPSVVCLRGAAQHLEIDDCGDRIRSGEGIEMR